MNLNAYRHKAQKTDAREWNGASWLELDVATNICK
jgi:hypothetical protein